MNDVASPQAGQGSQTDAQQAWLQNALGINIAAYQSGAAAPGGASGGAPGGGSSDKALDATRTDFFFDKDSSTLTPKDQQSLEKYANAYRAAKSAASITIDGYASDEGDKGYNKDLSDKRAKAVAAYLIDHGVPKDKVTTTPHGATEKFSKDELRQNRRATIDPPPPSSFADDPTMPHGLGGMRDGEKKPQQGGQQPQDGQQPSQGGQKQPIGLPQLDEESGKKIVGTDTDVPRAEVERKLKEFLEEVAKSQKVKKIKATGRAQVAEFALRKGLKGSPYVENTDTQDYDPDDLASKIAQNLPDKIPGANYIDFLHMKPVEEKKHGSLTDDAHEKYVEARNDFVKKLPKWAQDEAKKVIDGVVEKGESYILGKGLDALDPPLKDEMKKFVDDWTKKVTGGSDDKSK